MKRLLLCASAIFLWMGAGPLSRVYRNDAMRVRAFDPPPGWLLAPQQSYPRVLALYTRAVEGKTARITLVAQKVASGETAEALADASRAPLEKEGFRDLQLSADGERARIDGKKDRGKWLLKQLYVVQAGLGYVVTLVGPADSEAKATRLNQDFDDAVRSLQLIDEAPSEPSR